MHEVLGELQREGPAEVGCGLGNDRDCLSEHRSRRGKSNYMLVALSDSTVAVTHASCRSATMVEACDKTGHPLRPATFV